jgi:hypothetical protein
MRFMTAFEFAFSETFLVETFLRARRCRSTTYTAFAKVLLGVCLAASVLGCLWKGLYSGAATFALFLVWFVLADRIDDWIITKNFRTSPHCGDRIRIEVSADGLTGGGADGTSLRGWQVFTAGRRLSDGFLLFQGPGVYTWLPVNAIVSGSDQEVDGLLRSHVADYKPI